MVYELEYEMLNADSTVFEYLSTAEGLKKWFADEATLLLNKNFLVVLDDDKFELAVTTYKVNKYIKLNFVEEGEVTDAFVEFRLERNEMTEVLYLVIRDGSGMVDSLEDCREIWDVQVSEIENDIIR